MSTRHLRLAWIASIAAFGLFCAFVLQVSSQTPPVMPTISLDDDVEIVVLGSSMTHAAFPASGSLLDGGRSHKRYSVDGMGARQSLAMLDRVMRLGVSTVIVEANDFLFYRSFTATLGERVAALASGLAGQFRRGLNVLDGTPIVDMSFRGKDFQNMTGVLTAKRRKSERRYEVVIRNGDNVELAGLVDRARQKEIDVVLYVPPYSKFFDKKLKNDERKAINQRADTLAEKLGVRFWKPDAPWENDFFFDPVHLNFQGRDRFLREFNNWLQSTS